MHRRLGLTLEPDGLWLGIAEQAVERFGEVAGFSPALRRMLAESALEACEELIRACGEAGVREPFHLTLERRGEAVILEIDYHGAVPLHPHQAEDYDVPDAGSDLHDVDTGSLWLHLIRRRMDRVSFRVQGPRRVLRLVKYGREEGRERQAWVMVLKPKLRGGLHLHLSDPEAPAPAGVLQKPGGAVLRLGPGETFAVRRMDGETSMHDIYMAHVDELGLISPSALAALYEILEQSGMLADGEEARPAKWKTVLHRLLNPDVSIPRADEAVAWVHARTRLLCTAPGAAALVLAGLSGLIPAVAHWEAIRDSLAGLEQTFLQRPALLLPLYLLVLAHVALHELAHGVACKHFGGRVPRLGIMFYLTGFIFYCDTTAAWNFPSRRQRILVSLAGPLTTFAVLGAGLWAAGAEAGTGSARESLLAAFNLSAFFGLAMNFNPFLRMDAYYMLMDALDIPNLRTRAFAFLERRLLGRFGFGEDREPAATPRERRAFWWYGLAGTAATLLFFVLPMLQLATLLRAESASGGRLVLLAGVLALALARLCSVTFRKVKALRHRQYRLSA